MYCSLSNISSLNTILSIVNHTIAFNFTLLNQHQITKTTTLWKSNHLTLSTDLLSIKTLQLQVSINCVHWGDQWMSTEWTGGQDLCSQCIQSDYRIRAPDPTCPLLTWSKGSKLGEKRLSKLGHSISVWEGKAKTGVLHCDTRLIFLYLSLFTRNIEGWVSFTQASRINMAWSHSIT